MKKNKKDYLPKILNVFVLCLITMVLFAEHFYYRPQLKKDIERLEAQITGLDKSRWVAMDTLWKLVDQCLKPKYATNDIVVFDYDIDLDYNQEFLAVVVGCTWNYDKVCFEYEVIQFEPYDGFHEITISERRIYKKIGTYSDYKDKKALPQIYKEGDRVWVTFGGVETAEHLELCKIVTIKHDELTNAKEYNVRELCYPQYAGSVPYDRIIRKAADKENCYTKIVK